MTHRLFAFANGVPMIRLLHTLNKSLTLKDQGLEVWADDVTIAVIHHQGNARAFWRQCDGIFEFIPAGSTQPLYTVSDFDKVLERTNFYFDCRKFGGEGSGTCNRT